MLKQFITPVTGFRGFDINIAEIDSIWILRRVIAFQRVRAKEEGARDSAIV
jgi:hypothetical protein